MNKRITRFIVVLVFGLTLAPTIHAVNYVNTVWSVDSAKKIDWGGTTKYSVQWLAGIATWNTQTPVVIAKDTLFTIQDLTVKDVSKPLEVWTGQWTHSVFADNIELNKSYLDLDTNNEKQNTITHELGHALGLLHSLVGNIMYFAQTTQITLGAQDKLDYDFLW